MVRASERNHIQTKMGTKDVVQAWQPKFSPLGPGKGEGKKNVLYRVVTQPQCTHVSSPHSVKITKIKGEYIIFRNGD